jgi:hypothetical protein
MTETLPKPPCYGLLDQVFPLGDDDLRSVRPDCRDCRLVQTCLKAASESEAGTEMLASRMAAMHHGSQQGLLGFLNRWSELKAMRRKASSRNQPRIGGR